MGRYEASAKQRRRRRRRSPVGLIIVILLLITLLSIIGTVALRSNSRSEAEVLPSQETTLPQVTDTIPTTEPATESPTEVTAEAITEVTTEPTTEPTTEHTEETTEATKPATESTTEPTVKVTEPPTDDEKAVGQQIADLANAQIGKPYAYGGVGPDAFDSSGFVLYCVKEITGKTLLHSTSTQAKKGDQVEKKDLLPGDVVFFWLSDPDSVEYEGIYIGDGKFVAARNQENPVSQMDMKTGYFKERYLFARRYW